MISAEETLAFSIVVDPVIPMGYGGGWNGLFFFGGGLGTKRDLRPLSRPVQRWPSLANSFPPIFKVPCALTPAGIAVLDSLRPQKP